MAILYSKDGKNTQEVPQAVINAGSFDKNYWQISKPTIQSSVKNTPVQPQNKRQIYRIGADIYDASNNKKIGATDWKNNWSGKSDVVEIAAPQNNQNSSSGGGSTNAGTAGDGSTSFKNSPEYQSLSEDMKALADTVNNAFNAKDEQTRLTAQEALAKAREMVDPYSKILLSFALDSIPNDFRVKKLTIEDQIKSNQESQAAIAEAMKTATLDQQQQLDQLRRTYEDNITNLQDQTADSGLTFSSKRADMERQIGNQNLDIMTSSNRSYVGKLKAYETSQAEAKRQADIVKAAGEQSLKDLARGAEQKIGTEGYNNLGLTDLLGNKIKAVGGTGDTPLYGGDIEQQRQQQILTLAQQIGQYSDPTQLKNLLNQ
jgi:hypothetical protein